MIRAALEAHAAASNRTFSDDRRQTVGASEVGQCARRVWFSKFEGEQDGQGRDVVRDEDHEDGWGARARGTVYEDAWWAPAMKAHFNGSLLYAGTDQRTLFLDYLSATPDGLLIGQPTEALKGLGVDSIDPFDEGADCIAAECKTADPRTKLVEAKPEHVFQVQVQLGMFRETTNHKPAYGVISYTDASFWDEVLEFPVRFDQGVFDVARDRARQIMTAGKPDDLRPEGWIAGGRECLRCAFAGSCGLVDQRRLSGLKDVAEIPADIAQAIETKAFVAKNAKARAAEATAEQRAKEDEIKELLTKAGARALKRGGLSVTWSSVKGRPSWDDKALREAAEAEGIDLSRFSTVGDPTDRLTINLKAAS